MTTFKSIAIRYARKSFVYDLLAWIPIDWLFDLDDPAQDDPHLFRLLKLLRIPRLFELLDVDKFKMVLSMYYDG